MKRKQTMEGQFFALLLYTRSLIYLMLSGLCWLFRRRREEKMLKEMSTLGAETADEFMRGLSEYDLKEGEDE